MILLIREYKLLEDMGVDKLLGLDKALGMERCGWESSRSNKYCGMVEKLLRVFKDMVCPNIQF